MPELQVIDDFIEDFQLDRGELSVLSAKDVEQLRSEGYGVEDLLERLVLCYGKLLHGSRVRIDNGFLKGERGVFTSDLAAVAIMRAIVSNVGLKHPGLEYPYFIDRNHPFQVYIHGIKDDTIGEEGFVYIVEHNAGFKNDPKGSWQYVSKKEVPISASLPVRRSDFNYPMFDVSNQKIIE